MEKTKEQQENQKVKYSYTSKYEQFRRKERQAYKAFRAARGLAPEVRDAAYQAWYAAREDMKACRKPIPVSSSELKQLPMKGRPLKISNTP